MGERQKKKKGGRWETRYKGNEKVNKSCCHLYKLVFIPCVAHEKKKKKRTRKKEKKELLSFV